MRKYMMSLVCIVLIVMSGAGSAYALDVNGTAFKKQTEVVQSMYSCGEWICYTTSTYYYLTIQKTDGSKVKGECESGSMIEVFNEITIGDSLFGSASLSDGYYTWNELIITNEN
jgi:hypothetical protein